MTVALVTGGNGFLGTAVIDALIAQGITVVCVDLTVKDTPDVRIRRVRADVCDPTELGRVFGQYRPNVVIHLASIVNPGKNTTAEQEYRVDVDGTRNVLAACVEHGVGRIVVSSSGAAYGYHSDSPPWITEDVPVRGNDEFTYSRHKRLVEEMLVEYRVEHPELEQVVFRIGTILGESVDNQITALFDRRKLLKVAGSDSPFVFVWHTDVAGAFAEAVTGNQVGIFNVAGDGALTVDELASRMGKSTVTLPAWLLRGVLRVGRRLGVTEHGPERVGFLQYRPVLDNRRLKEQFGYVPEYSSEDAFAARGRIGVVRRRFEKGLTVSRNDGPEHDGSEHDGSVRQVVEAASALDDKDFLAVVRAVVERRPSLSVLLSVVDTAAASLEPHRVEDDNTITDAEEVELPDTVVEVDEIIDVPVVLATDPRIPEPDYTEGGVPTFDRVREKIEGRFGTSIGSSELAHESPAGKSVDEQWDERQKAAKAKLEEIRRSM
eukprot:gene21876-26272_t